jgi:hypothetical protein
LTAPPFLSGLSDAELAMVEEHISPEIAEARAATLKAMKEAEQGWQRAIDKIGERAGLSKGADGTWRDPSMSVAA